MARTRAAERNAFRTATKRALNRQQRASPAYAWMLTCDPDYLGYLFWNATAYPFKRFEQCITDLSEAWARGFLEVPLDGWWDDTRLDGETA